MEVIMAFILSILIGILVVGIVGILFISIMLVAHELTDGEISFFGAFMIAAFTFGVIYYVGNYVFRLLI